MAGHDQVTPLEEPSVSVDPLMGQFDDHLRHQLRRHVPAGAIAVGIRARVVVSGGERS